MSQIGKRVKVERETVSGLVDKDVADNLKLYCEMVDHPVGYVLNEWLKVLFKKDAEDLARYRADKEPVKLQVA